jgi:hypothetical protein
METVLRSFFDEQVRFRLSDGTELDGGGVFIGSTEFFPLKILQDDSQAYREEFDLWLNEDWKPEQQQRRDEILSIYANKRRFSDLLEAVNRQQVVPFVGSGMSVSSGLPTWSDLLRRMRKFTKCNPAELECLLEHSQFEEAADFIAASINIRLLSERVEHELRIDDTRTINGAVRLLPGLFPGLAITTNLDQVLENLYATCGQPFNHVLIGAELARYRALRSPNDRFLLKLHGDCGRMNSRVLLSSEYEATYGKTGIVREELALFYRHNHLLFVGCSLGHDRTVRLVEETAAADPDMPRHYGFLPQPHNDAIRIERENFLTQRGIYPIWYGPPHDESLMALLDGLSTQGAGA